jgi:hypothetical protein
MQKKDGRGRLFKLYELFDLRQRVYMLLQT